MTTPPLSKNIADQLIAAIGADNIEKLQALFDACQLDINLRIPWDVQLPYQKEAPVTGLLHIAAYKCSRKVLEWLVENGADINARTNFFYLGAVTAESFIASALMTETSGRKDELLGIIRNASLITPQNLLLKSVRRKYLPGVRHALNAGADINGGHEIDPDWRALHHAVGNNDLAMMDYLIANRADVNGRCPATPLEVAASDGHPAALRLLLQHGADPALCGGKGASLIFRAVGSVQNTREMLDILFTGPEKLNPDLLHHPAATDYTPLYVSPCNGLMPLDYAIKNISCTQNVAAVPALIHHGAQWRQPDEHGESIIDQLIFQITARTLPIFAKAIKDMLEAGVDPFLRNAKGTTAYEASRRYPAIKEIFQHHCRPLHYKAEHFNPAADHLLDSSSDPTALLWYACQENLLAGILNPARWVGQEKALIAVKLALTKALPEPYATQYEALLDVTANRRAAAPALRSWLKRYADTPPETRARDE